MALQSTHSFRDRGAYGGFGGGIDQRQRFREGRAAVEDAPHRAAGESSGEEAAGQTRPVHRKREAPSARPDPVRRRGDGQARAPGWEGQGARAAEADRREIGSVGGFRA